MNNFPQINRTSLIIGLVLAAALIRLLPHPPNFAPIAAMALFSGAYMTDRRLAFLVPLAALFLTDLILGFHSTLAFVYAAFAVTVVLGCLLRRNRGTYRLLGVALSSSTLFFIITNFGTWLVQDLYPKDGAGLAACFAAAIPFFQHTVAGDLFFVLLLFGGMRLLERQENVAATASN